MSQFSRRAVPVIALCMAALLGGCVVVPERRGHYRGSDVYVPGPVFAGGWYRHR